MQARRVDDDRPEDFWSGRDDVRPVRDDERS
jgi:hypothetical protein